MDPQTPWEYCNISVCGECVHFPTVFLFIPNSENCLMILVWHTNAESGRTDMLDNQSGFVFCCVVLGRGGEGSTCIVKKNNGWYTFSYTHLVRILINAMSQLPLWERGPLSLPILYHSLTHIPYSLSINYICPYNFTKQTIISPIVHSSGIEYETPTEFNRTLQYFNVFIGMGILLWSEGKRVDHTESVAGLSNFI